MPKSIDINIEWAFQEVRIMRVILLAIFILGWIVGRIIR